MLHKVQLIFCYLVLQNVNLKDEYKTIVVASSGEFKDRGSRFIAYAYPIETEAEGLNYVKQLKKEHLKARHHCYAYRIGMDKNNFRANDDGEPSGTAGRPILGQLDSFEVTNLIVVVVRYFGGTKLGASGLINAYKQSAALALDAAEIVEKQVCDVYRIDFEYAIMGDVMSALKKVGLAVTKQHFEETAFLEVSIRQSEVEEQLLLFKAAVQQMSVEQAATIEKIEGLKITFQRTI